MWPSAATRTGRRLHVCGLLADGARVLRIVDRECGDPVGKRGAGDDFSDPPRRLVHRARSTRRCRIGRPDDRQSCHVLVVAEIGTAPLAARPACRRSLARATPATPAIRACGHLSQRARRLSSILRRFALRARSAWSSVDFSQPVRLAVWCTSPLWPASRSSSGGRSKLRVRLRPSLHSPDDRPPC